MPNADVMGAWSVLRAQIEAHRPGTRQPGSAPAATVPVTLLTGFLGAGKSTLLADLLENPHGLRIRALVNDVGSLPFDPSLVDVAGSVSVELTNGCGCCSATSDLASALSGLVRGGDCDLVVVEASGAADPAVLEHVVRAETAAHLDRVVTVVNGRMLLEPPGPHAETVERQLMFADCVVVSGCDLLDADEETRACGLAAARAPGRTVTASGAGRPAGRVLAPGSARGTRLPVGIDGPGHGDMCVRTVTDLGDMPRDRFVRALEGARPGLVRVKGRTTLDGHAVLVQMTPHSTVITSAEPGPAGVTFIARTAADMDGVIGSLC